MRVPRFELRSMIVIVVSAAAGAGLLNLRHSHAHGFGWELFGACVGALGAGAYCARAIRFPMLTGIVGAILVTVFDGTSLSTLDGSFVVVPLTGALCGWTLGAFASEIGRWVPSIRLPRPRLTVRMMMIAVAVVALLLGVGCGLQARSVRFRNLAREHGRASYPYLYAGAPMAKGLPLWPYPTSPPTRLEMYHHKMFDKYEEAARYPWFPVDPDPPEPK